MRITQKLALAVMTIATLAIGTTTTAAAAASATHPGTHARADAPVVATVDPVVTRTLDSNCFPGLAVRVGLYNGSGYGAPYGDGICGTRELSVENPSTGHWESFVLGTDHSMWHTWTGQSAWHSLSGTFCDFGYHARPCGVYGPGDNNTSYPNITVGGYGPNAIQEWCSTRQNDGTWKAWYACG
jgi:hypothetical protein